MNYKLTGQAPSLQQKPWVSSDSKDCVRLISSASSVKLARHACPFQKAMQRLIRTSSPADTLGNDAAVGEAEKRLLDLNRCIIATAACHSQLPDSHRGHAAGKGTAEAFAWDQVCVKLDATVLAYSGQLLQSGHQQA